MAFIEKRDGKPPRVHWRDPRTGKQHCKTCKNVEAARLFKRSIERGIDDGIAVNPHDGNIPLSKMHELWLASVSGGRSAKTRIGYESLWRCLIEPEFGSVKINRIDALNIETWISDMEARGLSASRVRHAYAMLKAILAAAVKARRLAVNPARDVDNLPKIARPSDRGGMRVLTVAQVERVADEITPPFGTLVRFAAYSGLRAGELGALRVRHLDLLAGTVVVERSVSDVNGTLILVPPKNGKTRVVGIPRFLCEELGAYLANRPHGPNDLVFTGRRGSMLDQGHLLKRHFRPALKRAGLPPVRFHDLRHTCASWLIAAKEHPKSIQEHLGHASIMVTMDTYGHLFPSARADRSAALDRIREAVADEMLTVPDGAVVPMAKHAR
jgi:integrase